MGQKSLKETLHDELLTRKKTAENSSNEAYRHHDVEEGRFYDGCVLAYSVALQKLGELFD